MFKIPILILTYNRPDHLIRLIIRINKIKPSKIYISCDGPKNNLDLININRIHNVVNLINKNSKVFKNFYKENKGIKLAPQSGISWFFRKEKMGIILEDDCLPNKFFFKYAETLLVKYKNNKKIYAISGYNPLEKTKFGDGFYFLSNYFLCWGWATWRRAWKNSYKTISDQESQNIFSIIKKIFFNDIELRYWKKTIKFLIACKIKTWDIFFLVSIWKKNAYCLLPNVNMIQNIGFDSSATTSPWLNYKVAKVFNYKKNINSPNFLEINKVNEDLIFNSMFLPKNFLYPWRLLYIIKSIIFSPKFFFYKIRKKFSK